MASILEVQRANHEDIERARREIITLLAGKCVTVSYGVLIATRDSEGQREAANGFLPGMIDVFDDVSP